MNHDIFKPLWDLMGLPYPGALMITHNEHKLKERIDEPGYI